MTLWRRSDERGPPLSGVLGAGLETQLSSRDSVPDMGNALNLYACAIR